MRLSLNWLQRYIDHGLSAEDLSFRLTMAGLEVEAIEKVGDDTVFEIEITPNRPDLLNMLGLAREVSAITDKGLNAPGMNEYDDGGEVDITIEDAEGCGRYIGMLIDGVKVKGTPVEHLKLLSSMGANGISNIVDITNFVMFEMGQPMHAFDFDKLEGGKIIVRRAKKGEKIVTLDDVERTLDESILVIADAKKPVAIAGIMGGRDTGVTSSTKRVLLEAASFDLGMIRRASRKLGLTSDSCYRFERGVAWRTVDAASNRATDLILELAGGTAIARKDVIAAEPEKRRHEVVVTLSDIEKLLGAPLELARCEKILRRLGCIVAVGEKRITVVPPHFRGDIRIKEDVIEEVARVIGYDNLPMSLPHVPAQNIPVDFEREDFFNKVTRLMIAEGFHQTVNYALISKANLEKTGYSGPVIKLQNPMSAEQEVMRPTALPGLLLAAAFNMNHGQKNLKLFEVGKRYLPGGERWTLSCLMTGQKDADWRRSKKDLVDFYDLKGALEDAMSSLRVNDAVVVSASGSFFEEGHAGQLKVNGQDAGVIGKVSAEVLTKFEIKKASIFFAEIDLEILRDAVAPQGKFAEINALPASTRDISLALKDAAFEQLRELAFSVGGDLLKKFHFVELYQGDKIEAGYKGYVLSLTYQSSDRTLTDDEVNSLHERIVGQIVEKFDAKRR